MVAAPNQLPQELAYLKMLQGFTGAGGAGAAQGLGGAGSALGIYGGLEQGTPMGDVRAAISAGNLYNNFSGAGPSPLLSGAGGALGLYNSALGLYNNLQQGGVEGYTSAALDSANLAGEVGTLAGGEAAGGLGAMAGLSAYAGPIGLALAPALYGASQPSVQLNSTWYNNLGNLVKQGMAPGATPEQKLQAASQLQELGITGMGAGSGNLEGNPVNMQRVGGELGSLGIDDYAQAQQVANQLENSIPAGQMPTIGPQAGTVEAATYGPGYRAGNFNIHTAARGGSMNLHDLYKGSFRHFADGGSGGGYEMYANYGASPPASSDPLNYYTPYGAGSQLNYQDPNTGQVVNPAANQSGGYTMNPDGTVNTGSFSSPSASGLQGISPTLGGSSGVPGLNLNIPGALGLPGSLGQSGLGSLWNGLNTGQQLGTLGGLLAGIGAATNNGQNLSQQYHPAPPPMFANTGPQGTAQNTATGPNMYGNFSATPRQQTTPANIDWAHIGEGPMPSFFGPGAAPAPTPPPATGGTMSGANGALMPGAGTMTGGATQGSMLGQGAPNLNQMTLPAPLPSTSIPPVVTPSFPQSPTLQSIAAPAPPPMMTTQPLRSARWSALAQGGQRGLQGLLDGPGDGTSDDIVPAALSAGEYVVPAHVVSALGNGDNKAGARRLDAMQKNVRVSAGRAMAKNQHPTGKNRAKQPESYMRGAE